MTGYDFIVGIFGAVLTAFIVYDIAKGIVENNKANKHHNRKKKGGK